MSDDLTGDPGGVMLRASQERHPAGPDWSPSPAGERPSTHFDREGSRMGSVDLDTVITVGKVAGIVIGALVDIVKALA